MYSTRPLSGRAAGIKLFAIILLVLLFHAGCSEREAPVEVDLTKREDIGFEQDPNTITYAYLPQYFHRVSFERHNPIVQHLRKETGLPIRQVFPDSFDDFMKMVGQGKIDIFFSNPFVYVRVAERFGSRAFARIIELDGRENFRGLVICRNDNMQIQTIEDCRGRRWVAVDPSSAGGYLYALGLFHDHGIRKDDFAEIAFVPGPGGQQEKVVFAVLSGRYEIGSVREGTLELVANKVDLNEIRIITHTPWYPGWMYGARKGLDPRIVDTVRDALLKLDQSDPQYKSICDAAHFLRVISARDSDFDPIRSLAGKVGIALSE
ncbi:MAG: phosphate/phosphite/phosphonate ABC transporter substrate-binding protein [Deltaproteobacteria bacterium]|nr:phosphate/phosphite/phosphonate ABC transporter substrate-binding protein [Deltaproteobacteria bacterium]